jgi:osmotically-inducible protein OsmY
MSNKLLSAVLTTAIVVTLGCNKTSDVSYKDTVVKALEQADLRDVSVSEDKDNNKITLSGTLHSQEAKDKAMDITKSVAPTRVIANEVSVQPVGFESQAKDIASNLDSAIEKEYKAALISSGLDKQDISYDVKNGVLTLKGKVRSADQKRSAERLAQNISQVQQVVNQIELKS